jgi:hypothetical protein
VKQANFSIYHQNYTVTFEDKSHHILTRVGICIITVIQIVVAQTGTEEKEIVPRPFLDTKETSDRT